MKIAASALAEMGRAFELFARYRGIPKLTMFGSARTAVSDPLYAQAVDLAARMAREKWLVVTGAGPGIMAAGTEGAGSDMSLGVEIRLPFETISHPQLAAEGRLVEMKYFFTRKLMLMKESAAFAVLPGRLRDPRRVLRAAHLAPDRQGRAGADRAAWTFPATLTGRGSSAS